MLADFATAAPLLLEAFAVEVVYHRQDQALTVSAIRGGNATEQTAAHDREDARAKLHLETWILRLEDLADLTDPTTAEPDWIEYDDQRYTVLSVEGDQDWDYADPDHLWVQVTTYPDAEAAGRSWLPEPLEEAPVDGHLYARQDGQWIPLTSTSLETSIDDHSVAGTTISRTAAASTTRFQAAYLTAAAKAALAQADAAVTMPAVCLAAQAIGADAEGLWLLQGLARDDSWNWTPGAPLYIDPAVAGGLTQTRPTASGHQVQIVGYAWTSKIIFWYPNTTIVEIV
jgi:hypothetical protein